VTLLSCARPAVGQDFGPAAKCKPAPHLPHAPETHVTLVVTSSTGAAIVTSSSGSALVTGS
jgi:hypothetical protein